MLGKIDKILDHCNRIMQIGEYFGKVDDFLGIRKRKEVKERRKEIFNAYIHGQISYEEKKMLFDKPENRRSFSLVKTKNF